MAAAAAASAQLNRLSICAQALHLRHAAICVCCTQTHSALLFFLVRGGFAPACEQERLLLLGKRVGAEIHFATCAAVCSSFHQIPPCFFYALLKFVRR
jgi:hypothetical protein